MATIESGEKYEHDEYGTIQVHRVIRKGYTATVEVDGDEATLDELDANQTVVEFQQMGSQFGFGPGTMPLGEFVAGVDINDPVETPEDT